MIRVTLITAALIFSMFATSAIDAAQDQRDPLFHIERNKNANIVQYDAQLSADGSLNRKEPVVAYWVRHAEQGQQEKLSWVQNNFAYGFNARADKKTGAVRLDMKAEIGRPLMVRSDGGDYRASANIDGREAWVDRIYIHATGKGMSTKVDYIELYGSDVESAESRYEKIIP